MINKNIQTLRKRNGYSQEALAQKLNVVRQTVSKWEKGMSVPDAHMLIKMADLFDVEVSDLLGETINDEKDINDIASQLAKLNEELALKNGRSRKFWKVMKVLGIVILVWLVLITIIGIVSFEQYGEVKSTTTQEISE